MSDCFGDGSIWGPFNSANGWFANEVHGIEAPNFRLRRFWRDCFRRALVSLGAGRAASERTPGDDAGRGGAALRAPREDGSRGFRGRERNSCGVSPADRAKVRERSEK